MIREVAPDIWIVQTLTKEDASNFAWFFDMSMQWEISNIDSNDSIYRKVFSKILYGDESFPEHHKKIITIAAGIDSAVVRVAMKYLPQDSKYGSYLRYTTCEQLQLLKYSKGCFYKEHMDLIYGEPNPRNFSTVLYLNDDYDGGEVEFPRQNFKYKPKAGECIVFPSGYTHPYIEHEVTDGEKYCVATWFR
jgi:hypothetical protein